jgi:hypothetical protein
MDKMGYSWYVEGLFSKKETVGVWLLDHSFDTNNFGNQVS